MRRTTLNIFCIASSLLSFSACSSPGDGPQITTHAPATAESQHGAASVSVLPMASTQDVATVVMTIDGITNHGLGYNPANGNFYTSGYIDLTPGDHTLVLRAYSTACEPDACVPGSNQVGEGTTTVNIVAGQQSLVFMRILDMQGSDQGTTNHEPLITTVIVSTPYTGVNTPIHLTAVAIDPDGTTETANINYEWTTLYCTADQGAYTFSNSTAASTTWQSSVVQDCTLTLTVRDGSVNYLSDSLTLPPIQVASSSVGIAPFTAWFIPNPRLTYVISSDADGTMCVQERGTFSDTCHMDFTNAIEFDIYVDAGIESPDLSEIDVALTTDDYCLGVGIQLAIEEDMPNSTWVHYHYVWEPGNTYNNLCTLSINADHLGMTDSATMVMAADVFVGYFQMLDNDLEGANDSTSNADYIPSAFSSVVNTGDLGSDDYYAINVGPDGEDVVVRSGGPQGNAAAGFDTLVEIYEANVLGELVLLASDDNSGPGAYSELYYSFPARGEDRTYYIRIARSDGSVGEVTDLYSLYFDRYRL